MDDPLELGGIYFRNPKYTQLVQIIVSFAFGIIFAPYSYGFIYLVIYLFLYEVIYFIFTRGEYPYWTPLFRFATVAASLLGWIIGRVIVGWKNPFRANPNQD